MGQRAYRGMRPVAFNSGGTGYPWVFLPVTVFVALYLVRVIAHGRWIDSHQAVVGWLEAAIVVVLAASWYFGISRFSFVRATRNVRTQEPDAVVVAAAKLTGAALRWTTAIDRGETGIAPRLSRAAVVVATKAGMHIWVGGGDPARPIATLEWSELAAITAPQSGFSSTITMRFVSGQSIDGLSLFSTRPFSTIRVRGRALRGSVAQLEALRSPQPEFRVPTIL